METKLNEVHPSLTFTMESESQGQLPFIDVGIRRTDSTIVRSVYRKPTFTGLYTKWDSFCDTKQKISLVRSLTSREIKICSKSTLQEELNNLRRIFEGNGYPRNVIESTISKTVQSTVLEANSKTVEDLVRVDPVVIRLLWIGRHSTQFRHGIVCCVCLSSVSA